LPTPLRQAKVISYAAKLGYLLPMDIGEPSATHTELAELAAKARRLITENDPDAIRAGLREIAQALEGLAGVSAEQAA
jgi:hypothetical protein